MNPLANPFRASGLVKTFENHFRLDEGKLRKIVDVLRTHMGKLDFPSYLGFYLEQSNDRFFRTPDIDEVLAHDNPEGSEVRELYIEVERTGGDEDEKKKKLVTIAFTPTERHKVWISITAPSRDWCFVLADELEAQVRRTHEIKKNKLLDSSNIDAYVIVPPLLLILIAIVVTRSPSHLESVLKGTTDQKLDYVVRHAFGLIPMLSPLISTFASVLVLSVIFVWKPIVRFLSTTRRSVFYWGDAKVRFDKAVERAKLYRWGLIAAFGVSIASGLVVMAIQLRFFSAQPSPLN